MLLFTRHASKSNLLGEVTLTSLFGGCIRILVRGVASLPSPTLLLARVLIVTPFLAVIITVLFGISLGLTSAVKGCRVPLTFDCPAGIETNLRCLFTVVDYAFSGG